VNYVTADSARDATYLSTSAASTDENKLLDDWLFLFCFQELRFCETRKHKSAAMLADLQLIAHLHYLY